MNRSRKFAAAGIILSASFFLSGCSNTVDDNGISTNVIPLSSTVVVSNFPSWNESSIKVLEDNDWVVSKVEPNPGQNSKNWVSLYTAQSKDGSCNISLGLDGQYLILTGNDEEYETREYMYLLAKNQEAEIGEESTKNINVNDKNQSITLMTLNYNYPNKIYSSDIILDPNNPTAPAVIEPEIDGFVEVLSASRVLSSENTNPFYIKNPEVEALKESGGKLPPDYVGDIVRPVINVKYECVNKKLDMELWNNLLNNSVIDMDITNITKPE